MKETLVLVLVALVLAVGLVACAPASSPTPLPPTETPTPPPTALPTATPAAPAAEETRAGAWVSQGRAGWGSVQTVSARLTRGGRGVSGALMYCIVRDQDADRRWPEEGYAVTGEDGIASTSALVVENPEGAPVQVDVYLVHEGSTYQARTSFVSHC